MTTIGDIIDGTVDDAFNVLGEDATYTPFGGSGVTVKVIPRRPDEIVGLGEIDIQTPTAVFDVRVSEVGSPAAKDTILFDSTTYTVQGTPQRLDPRRRIWTLNTRP